jgi:hypothetical protein
MFQKNYYHFYRIICLQIAFLAISFSLSRWLFLLLNGNHQVMLTMPFDLFDTLFIGLRFDLRAATIACAPLFFY